MKNKPHITMLDAEWLANSSSKLRKAIDRQLESFHSEVRNAIAQEAFCPEVMGRLYELEHVLNYNLRHFTSELEEYINPYLGRRP